MELLFPMPGSNPGKCDQGWTVEMLRANHQAHHMASAKQENPIVCVPEFPCP